MREGCLKLAAVLAIPLIWAGSHVAPMLSKGIRATEHAGAPLARHGDDLADMSQASAVGHDLEQTRAGGPGARSEAAFEGGTRVRPGASDFIDRSPDGSMLRFAGEAAGSLDHPETLRDLGAQRSASHRVIIVAPSSQAEARRIFRSANDPAYMALAVQDASRAATRIGVATRESNARALVGTIRDSQENYISIIGHNEGGRLIFPDGSGIHLREVSARCREANKFCILLSCKSNAAAGSSSRGVYVRLTYGDAAVIAEQVARIIARARDRHISAAQLQRQIGQALAADSVAIAAVDALQMAYVPAGAAGTGALLISIDPD